MGADADQARAELVHKEEWVAVRLMSRTCRVRLGEIPRGGGHDGVAGGYRVGGVSHGQEAAGGHHLDVGMFPPVPVVCNPPLGSGAPRPPGLKRPSRPLYEAKLLGPPSFKARRVVELP
jgi:hypothetical protein